MPVCSSFPLLCLLLLFSRAVTGTVYGYGVDRCQFSSSKGFVYLEQYIFNKVLLLQYNSTLGNFTGYTDEAQQLADGLNKSPTYMRQIEVKEEQCKSFIPWAFDVLSRTVEPYVRLRSVDAAGSKHQAMLMCSAYNFWPKQIRVTWLRDRKEVTSDVTSTEELPDGDWFYQIHSYLEYTPRPEEKITCKVEHTSLMEPKFYDWVPTQSESEWNKNAVGTAGLLLGLLFLGAGLIYYKKNTIGRELVPAS